MGRKPKPLSVATIKTAHYPGAFPWERQEGESMMWYRRFDSYRLMGEDRSYLEQYRETCRDKLRDSGRATEKDYESVRAIRKLPPTWEKAVHEWSWKERAEAWDEYSYAKERKIREKMVEEERDARISMLAASRRLVSRELTEIVKDSKKIRAASWSSLVTTMESIIRLQREEFGEDRHRIEVSGPGGEPIRSEVETRTLNLESLDDETLVRLLHGLQAGDSGGNSAE